MNLRVLKYFIAVVKEGTISKASNYLHITQPTLSRQLEELESGLGKKLFIRGNRKITLTEEGFLLYKRAEEIIELVDKTKQELINNNKEIIGDIFIGCGETYSMKIIAKIIKKINKNYQKIKYHISSGNSEDLIEKLDNGLIDFCILIEPIDLSKYNYLKMPSVDKWGLIMRKNDPLAKNNFITLENIKTLPIICSRQVLKYNSFLKQQKSFNIVATYNLIYNATLLVEEGVGYALCLDKLINKFNNNLSFIPLYPELKSSIYIVWKKNAIFSKPTKKFLEEVERIKE